MQSRQQEKIYLDSNVWYSYITRGDYDPHYNKAYAIIESINKNNDSIAVISHLSLVELVNSIRNGVTKKAEYLGKIRDNTVIRQNLEKKIDGYIRDVMNLITRWEATGKLRIVDVTAPFTHVLKETQILQQGTFGYIKDSDKCTTCKQEYNGYRYSGVDHWVIQHALVAREANVDSFITFDGGFDKLKPYFDELICSLIFVRVLNV